jgi:hypothetical protein
VYHRIFSAMANSLNIQKITDSMRSEWWFPIT